MRQRLALIAVEKNNVARFGLLFAQLQAQGHPFHLAFRLTSLQRVPGPPPAEVFSQGLGQLRTADAYALARFDLGAEAGDRPVAPVGHRFFQQRGGDAQGGFTLHQQRARRDAGLQRCDTAGGEVAAPQANRIFAHAKRLRDLGAGPAGQRQKHRARPVRLAAIA